MTKETNIIITSKNKKKEKQKTQVDNKQKTFFVYPVLPLRELVVFPRMVIPLFIGREQSLKVVEKSLLEDHKVVVLSEKQSKEDSYPTINDLPLIGTLVDIIQIIRLPDKTMKILVEGLDRVYIKEFLSQEPFFKALVEIISEKKIQITTEIDVLIKFIRQQFGNFLSLAQRGLGELIDIIPDEKEPGKLADMIGAYLPISLENKQKILEEFDPVKRLEFVGKQLSREIELLTIEHKIQDRVRHHIEKHQKEYFLREKLKSIKEELGDEVEIDSEIKEYQENLKKLNVPQDIKDKINKEIKKLDKMPPISAETSVIKNYLDLVFELPWNKTQSEEIDLKKAQEILDEDHYGLEKVKERILEFLAVRKLSKEKQTTLICLVGPPGVGKTSVATSIARALNRKFERIALGGVGDDAEIRGHRRTYVGALPGRIIQALRHAKESNPVILLDEIDKLTKHFHGDPASALLEVLDPEQNNSFRDHYLDLPFDLSDVFFLAAANVSYTIPKPLLDRMEIIKMSGYTEEEKIQIAKKYLIKKQKKKNGIKPHQLSINTEVLKYIIRRYTKEAGVRELERSISKICRKVAKLIVTDGIKSKKVNDFKTLEEILGPVKFHDSKTCVKPEIGIVQGLAWTEVGGSVLPIEVALSPGKGNITLTGRLGEVMKESAQIALGYIKSKSKELKISKEKLRKSDVYLHVPEGAIPKDGPSAGIALTTALVSAFIEKPVKHDLAMTGEITLRGRVLPIGGLKEKVLAAHREGIKKVIIPFDNKSDTIEIPKDIRKQIQFIFVKDIKEVLDSSIVH